MTSSNTKRRVFLCHASEDKVQVRRAYEQLKKAGFDPWLDEKDLLPGQNWEEEIPRALKVSAAVLVFLSKTSVSKRGYVQREFRIAFDTLQEIPHSQVFVIPVKLDDCEVPELFRSLHWAKAGGERERTLPRSLAVCGARCSANLNARSPVCQHMLIHPTLPWVATIDSVAWNLKFRAA
jgi:hypothetical protein